MLVSLYRNNQRTVDAVVVVDRESFLEQQSVIPLHKAIDVSTDHQYAGFRVGHRFSDEKIGPRANQVPFDRGHPHAADEVTQSARLMHLGFAQGENAIVDHRDAVAIDRCLRQALIVVLFRHDLVHAIVDKIIGQTLDLVVVEIIRNLLVEVAQNVLERAYSGDMAEVEFNITGVGRKVHWRADVLTKPAKALDLHWLSADVRNMSLHDNVLRTLHYIMERRAFATQTLGFWRGSAQDAHQDSAYVNYSHPNQFLATWIALEDVTENCGELFYYVGSHRMEEYLYLDKYKGVEEAGRANPGLDFDAPIKDHVKKIPQVAGRMGLQRKRFLAKRGDVLIWHSDLAHGGSPISTDVTRKSIVTHYCTAEAVPSYFELKEGKRIMRHGGGYVGSSHYNTDLGF